MAVIMEKAEIGGRQSAQPEGMSPERQDKPLLRYNTALNAAVHGLVPFPGFVPEDARFPLQCQGIPEQRFES
jgi:hypothetical protein